MFISVDLPAPFSPSSACTSPSSRSSWIRSLASTPGKRFVTPLSSRTGGSATCASIERRSVAVPPTGCEQTKGGHEARPSRTAVKSVLLDGLRDTGDLARLQQGHLPGDGLLDRR